MSTGKSDTQAVKCPVCKTMGLYLPLNKYKFYAEHYYRHRLDAIADLKRQQVKYEAHDSTKEAE